MQSTYDTVSENVWNAGRAISSIFNGENKPSATDVIRINAPDEATLKGIIAETSIETVKSMAHSRIFVRLAGLSGAAAVIFGAYGAHGFKDSDADDRLKMAYDTGSKYHLLHSVALLGTPLCKRPHLAGCLMCAGIVLFSGSCYFHALTGNLQIRKVTPYGGMLLIAGWLALVL